MKKFLTLPNSYSRYTYEIKRRNHLQLFHHIVWADDAHGVSPPSQNLHAKNTSKTQLVKLTDNSKTSRRWERHWSRKWVKQYYITLKVGKIWALNEGKPKSTLKRLPLAYHISDTQKRNTHKPFGVLWGSISFSRD